MIQKDPFENVFGIVRIAIDKIRELEQRGQIYGLSRYLPNSIIVMKTIDYPLIVDLYLPGFTFYFQFSIIQDKQSKQIFVDDFRVVYPQPFAKQVDSLVNFEPTEEIEGEEE